MQEGGENFSFYPFKSVGATLFRVTKEQDTSDIEMQMSLATVPLPQEQLLAYSDDGILLLCNLLFCCQMMFGDLDIAEKQNTAMSQSCDTATLKSITVLPHGSILDLYLAGLEIQIKET